MLKLRCQETLLEAGCDEAGRGCLAGPVFAAAVILPDNFFCTELNDSKKLSEEARYSLRPIIEQEAIAWAVGIVDHEEIDRINILNASFLAMHRAISKLKVTPELLLIDGNRFKKYLSVEHRCISIYAPIAAASVLAKTYRDDFMLSLHDQFPQYGWHRNKGYATLSHRNAIAKFGLSAHHRKTFHLKDHQVQLDLSK
jgi:ribonuclease HII